MECRSAGARFTASRDPHRTEDPGIWAVECSWPAVLFVLVDLRDPASFVLLGFFVAQATRGHLSPESVRASGPTLRPLFEHPPAHPCVGYVDLIELDRPVPFV